MMLASRASQVWRDGVRSYYRSYYSQLLTTRKRGKKSLLATEEIPTAGPKDRLLNSTIAGTPGGAPETSSVQ
jgi:hypothetical protein